MKENRIYKKLGEVCDVKTGKLDANASDENGLYPFFTCSKEPLRINTYSYDSECILVAGNGDLNVKYYNGKFDAYQRTYIITLKNGITDIYVRYLYCFFLLYVETLRKKSIGGVIKYIKLGDITEAKVYIPSLSTQSRIVSELDLLQSIIDKQQTQLKELNTLAQAVFYDMFGDPVENEKGWEVKKLGECCVSVSYGTSAPSSSQGKFIYLRMNNITYGGELDLTDVKYIDLEPTDFEKYSIKEGDILFNRTNSAELVGKTTWFHKLEPMVIAGYIIRVRLNETLLPVYVSIFLNTKEMKLMLKAMGKGAVNQANINSKELQGISIPVPPLPLQQSFAAKIESIEKQKAAISKSIAETKKLYDYTMDKYFG